jgi:hypothetical protein
MSTSSACNLIFAAGRNRLLLDGARLGFHGSYFPGMTSYFPGMTKAELAAANAK